MFGLCGSPALTSFKFSRLNFAATHAALFGHLQEHTVGYSLFGVVDWRVPVAGLAGGVARGLVEAPFDSVKAAPPLFRPLVRRWYTFDHRPPRFSVALGRSCTTPAGWAPGLGIELFSLRPAPASMRRASSD